jgi:GT2 family glycosyltransferase
MKICAIILNYRNAVRTEACLHSLIGQGLDSVLVVDNSDDEGFASELSTMLKLRLPQIDYTLHLLKSERNLGFARGVNRALNHEAAFHCDTFLLINNDAIAMPGMVARMAARLSNTGCKLIAPHVLDAAGRPQSMLWYQRFFGLLTTRPLPGSFAYPSGCCLLLRRELLVDGKLLDEDFFMYGEDTQLGWRLMQAREVVGYLDDVAVRHSGVGSSRQYGMFYEYHTARAHVLLARKTLRHPMEKPLMLITKGAGLMLRAVLRSWRSRSLVPLKAYVLAWRAMEIRLP